MLVVTIEVRSHGNAERGRGAGCKSWLLKNVIFTRATDPPTPAPPATSASCNSHPLDFALGYLTYTVNFGGQRVSYGINHYGEIPGVSPPPLPVLLIVTGTGDSRHALLGYHISASE